MVSRVGQDCIESSFGLCSLDKIDLFMTLIVLTISDQL